jgi:Flp pilus assembly protein TadD
MLAACALTFAEGTSSARPVPPSSSALSEKRALMEGQEAIAKGDLAGARVDFEKAVKLVPGDARALASLGWVLWQQGNWMLRLRDLLRRSKGRRDLWRHV